MTAPPRDASTPAVRARAGRGWWIALVAICAARFALSMRGLDYGLPEAHEPDIELVRQSLHFRGEVSAKPQQLAIYPHLVSRLMSWVPRPESIGEIDPGGELAAHLRFASRHILAGRLCVAILAACAVPLTWILARRFLEPPWALFATALFATSLMHFDYSQQARPHGPLASFVLAALLASAALARRPTLARYAVAGAAASLAVGVLHSGSLVLLGGLAAHWIASRGRGWRGQMRLAIPLALVAIGVVLFYPFLLDQGFTFAGSEEPESSDFPHKLRTLNGTGFAKVWGFLWDYDPILWALALAGASIWVVRAVRGERSSSGSAGTDFLVFASALLPYLLVIGLYSQVFVRFLEPIVPFGAVIAAWGVRELSRRFRPSSYSRLVPVAFSLVSLALPTYLIVRLGSLRAEPDTFSRCATWIEQNAVGERDEILLAPTLSLPLFHTIMRGEDYDPWASPASHFWYRYLWDLPIEASGFPTWRVAYVTRGGYLYMNESDFPLRAAKAARYLTELDGDWAVVMSGGKPLDSVRDATRERGELAQRISPWDDGSADRPLGLDFRADGFWHELLESRCHGPMLEVYRLSREH